MPLIAYPLMLFQASLASVVAGLLLCAMLWLAVRRWPALAARRSPWLAAQLLLAGVFILSLLPHSQVVSVVPEMHLPVAASVPEQAITIDRLPAAANPLPASAAPDWPPLLALLLWIWLVMYTAGMALAAWRQWRSHARLAQLLSLARTIDAPSGRQQPRLQWLEVDAPVSPMLLGLWRRRLLLPAHLAQFSPQQQQLMIEHELTHARRHDPLLQALSLALQALLWFNPLLHWLGQRLAWAQELGCDAQVLAGRPQSERKQYAAALVAQLRQQRQQQRLPALAFAGQRCSPMADRLLRMRDAQPARMSWRMRLLGVLAMVGAAAASLALQPALAWTVPVQPQPPGSQATAPASALPAWRNPLEQMRVTGFFGVVRPTNLDGLRGLDLAAKRGTPVHATADGIATASEDARLGKTVRVDHGGGWQSWYVHLDRVDISDGEVVASGQVIGTVGDTGFATGPHLHFQVWHNGRLQDPQSRLAGLDANASARALRMRREQFGR